MGKTVGIHKSMQPSTLRCLHCINVFLIEPFVVYGYFDQHCGCDLLLVVTVEENQIGQLDRDNCCDNISLQLNNILTELRTLKQEVHWT